MPSMSWEIGNIDISQAEIDFLNYQNKLFNKIKSHLKYKDLLFVKKKGLENEKHQNLKTTNSKICTIDFKQN